MYLVVKIIELFKKVKSLRKIIVFFDSLIFIGIYFSFIIAISFATNYNWHQLFNPTIFFTCLVTLVLSWILFGVYNDLVRFGVFHQFKLFLRSSIITLFVTLLLTVLYIKDIRHFVIGFITITVSSAVMLLYRALYRMILLRWKAILSNLPKRKYIAIFGAGQLGLSVLQLLNASNSQYQVLAFFDDDKDIVGKTIAGIKVYPANNLKEITERLCIEEMIMAVKNLSNNRKSSIVNQLIDFGIKVKHIGSFDKWLNNQPSYSLIQEIDTEALLSRESITDDSFLQSKDAISGSKVLVTGAAGSIGSELVKQILKCSPDTIVCLDIAESALHSLSLEILNGSSVPKVHFVLGDIRDFGFIDKLFSKYNFDFVYHAAAYKHVPVMEDNPFEGVKTNILGTKNLADISAVYHVKKFVLVSTDKAVNPTSVMGLTKRFAEIYIQSYNQFNHQTRFITTRFGNVLGSNGSVVPLFKEQIAKGGPLTVTDPDVVRYFMTIKEASQLVVQASVIGNGGEIFVFEMGEPVRILDLAEKMIRMSGLQPYIDIDIVFTGLREGEKMYEELFKENDTLEKSPHPKIMIGRTIQYQYKDVLAVLDELVKRENSPKERIIHVMRALVPEFEGQVKLDNKIGENTYQLFSI